MGDQAHHWLDVPHGCIHAIHFDMSLVDIFFQLAKHRRPLIHCTKKPCFTTIHYINILRKGMQSEFSHST